MPIDALRVLCAQLTSDLLAIAKFLFYFRLVFYCVCVCVCVCVFVCVFFIMCCQLWRNNRWMDGYGSVLGVRIMTNATFNVVLAWKNVRRYAREWR